MHQGPALPCAHLLRGWIWMRTQLDVEAAACWGCLDLGRLLEPPAALPFCPEHRGCNAALALLTAQGEGRALWGQGWKEKDGIEDS